MSDVKVIVNAQAVPCGAVRIEGRTYARAADVLGAVGVVGFTWDEASMTGSWQVLGAPPLLADLAPSYVSRAQSWARPLTQAKVDYLWAMCGRALVDPRLMLAILPQEGTGSFDTVPNTGADGGGGPDDNWIRDVERAIQLVTCKLSLWPQASGAFRTACQAQGFDGTVIQWLNWATAVLRPGGQVQLQQTYANDAQWWRGVQEEFVTLGGSVAGLENALPALATRMHVPALPPLTYRLVEDNPSLASDDTGFKPGRAVVAFPQVA